MIGFKFGHYEIRNLLGAGGMGEVYEAVDNLGRSVAVKCLPEAFTHDAERVARFQREARLLASLNHPSVASIYGLEESAGRHFLVMELIPGDTLDQRIRRGPIPAQEALGIAKQIADGLEAAHEKGIVHRDLKPANIKLTPDGAVKVLDFGLAKAMEDPGRELSELPTVSLAMTSAGLILGTPAYMSPEQARGSEADKRADVWAFGVVLYEMLTGKRLFDEPNTSDTLAAVLKADLQLDNLPGSIPPSVRELLSRCLERDRRRRLRDIGEARITLENLLANPSETSRAPRSIPDAPRPFSGVLPWAIAAVSLFAVGIAWVRWPEPVPPPSMHLDDVGLGADAELSLDPGLAVVVSPDGTTMVFTATENKTPALYVRKLDELKASALAGTVGAQSPFFKPDGQWIGFFAGGKLKKVPVNGGAVETLHDARPGGTWTEDGFIIFARNSSSGLLRISEKGGTPETLTELDTGEVTHRWPQMLPGGKAVLFTTSSSGGNFEEASILVQTIPNGKKKVVYRGGSFGRFVLSGHLLYIHESTLFSAPFDLDKLEMTDTPVRVLEGVSNVPRSGGAQFSVSDNGLMVYVPGSNLARRTPQLAQWTNQDGETASIWTAPDGYSDPRVSPDGSRVAATIVRERSGSDQGMHVWVSEPNRDLPSRVSSSPELDGWPVWVGNDRIAFASRRGNKKIYNIYLQPIDGIGEPQQLTKSNADQHPTSWDPNRKLLAFNENGNIMILPMTGDEKSGWKPGTPYPFLASPFVEEAAAFSPDGRWLAYVSNESGRDEEVYVRPFHGPSTDPGRRTPVSSSGGFRAVWSKAKPELLYFDPATNQVMVSRYTEKAGSFEAAPPVVWSKQAFPVRVNRLLFDLHPDGKKIVIITPAAETKEKQDSVSFFLNFFDELRRLSSGQR